MSTLVEAVLYSFYSCVMFKEIIRLFILTRSLVFRTPGKKSSKPLDQISNIPQVDSSSFYEDVFVACSNDRQSPLSSEDRKEYDVEKWAGRPYQPVPMHRQFAALACRGFLDTMR